VIASEWPRVSILLPCRQAEPFLEGCIASLENQTESRFEALALDDASVDRTGDILAAWAKRDTRVRIVEPDGSGLIAALKRLAGEARAPYLARMDADDIARPGRLAAQIALLDANPDLAACGTGVRYFPSPARGSGYARYENWINSLTDPGSIARDLLVECPIAHPTLMIRQTVFNSMGGYREVDGPEDYDLILRLSEAGYHLTNVPEVLHEWRLGSHRLSERSARYHAEAFRRLKVSYLRQNVVSEDRPLVIWGAGKVGKAFARAWLVTGDQRLSAFVDLDPRKIGQTIHGARVIGVTDLAVDTEVSRRPFILVAVGTPGAREDIRTELHRLGFNDQTDYRVVA